MDEASVIVLTFLACAAGVLLGSILPADLLARRRGIDIRAVGDGNPGTVNAIKGLGWGAGLLTGAYDASVGVLALSFARVLGLPDGSAYLAGVAAVAGHRFPVFRRFKGGGQGMAASAGLLLFGVATALSRGVLSAVEVALLVAVGLVTLGLTRSDVWVAVVLLPVLLGMILIGDPGWTYAAFMAVVAANIWIVQVGRARQRASSNTDETSRAESRPPD